MADTFNSELLFLEYLNNGEPLVDIDRHVKFIFRIWVKRSLAEDTEYGKKSLHSYWNSFIPLR